MAGGLVPLCLVPGTRGQAMLCLGEKTRVVWLRGWNDNSGCSVEAGSDKRGHKKPADRYCEVLAVRGGGEAEVEEALSSGQVRDGFARELRAYDFFSCSSLYKMLNNNNAPTQAVLTTVHAVP